jgi:hypothetical protein
MKKLILFLSILSISFVKIKAGTLRGAWEMVPESSISNERVVMVASFNYLSISVFEKNLYIRCYGGPFQIKDDDKGGAVIELLLEFNDKHSESVGTKIIYKYSRKENEFTLENQLKTTWRRIDSNEGIMAGLWQITAREGKEGQMTEMKTGPRKTIKICTGTRFQWLAINPETKEFSGTGGGTYIFKDGRYTETIEFFLRDNSRVTASLSFDAKVENDQWFHSGKSSKGDRVSEIWKRVE